MLKVLYYLLKARSIILHVSTIMLLFLMINNKISKADSIEEFVNNLKWQLTYIQEFRFTSFILIFYEATVGILGSYVFAEYSKKMVFFNLICCGIKCICSHCLEERILVKIGKIK